MNDAVTREQIVAGLRELCLKAGDIVLLHSSLSSLGRVDGGARAVKEAFLDVLGADGTLVVPTFGNLGVIPDEVKTDRRAVASIHPMASVAAIGAKAEEICREHWKALKAHVEDTPYTRIAELGGYVCLLGVDQDRSTLLHTAEETLELSYLATTKPVTFDTPEGEVKKSWPFFPGPHRDFIGLDKMLRDSGRMRLGTIGSAMVRLIRGADLIELAVAAGRADPAFVLCDNPNCRDCVSQRAALRRARLARESFSVAAVASLAGRYVDEMIDNLRAAGIDRVELDFINGRAVQALEGERVISAVEQLGAADIEIAAIRSSAVTDKNLQLIETAARCKVGRVVLPISTDAEGFGRAGRERAVAVSFVNTDMDSARVSQILLDLRAAEVEAGFVFNAANFARVGENPFLGSYKAKLRRFVDQLDVGDAVNDGPATPLAGGHAEIKEMVSILRAAGFDGYMTLSGDNRRVGTLLDAAKRFEHLLDTM